MPEVLEIEQVETKESQKINRKWDSWTIEIPQEIVEAQGLTEGALVSLTYRNGRIETEIIIPSARTKESLKRFVKNNREFLEEMKRLGD